MTRRVIGFEPLVLPAHGFCAGMGLHGSAPHSRGAKRRENTALTRRLWRVAVERQVKTLSLVHLL
jgi:hypothetical protein